MASGCTHEATHNEDGGRHPVSGWAWVERTCLDCEARWIAEVVYDRHGDFQEQHALPTRGSTAPDPASPATRDDAPGGSGALFPDVDGDVLCVEKHQGRIHVEAHQDDDYVILSFEPADALRLATHLHRLAGAPQGQEQGGECEHKDAEHGAGWWCPDCGDFVPDCPPHRHPSDDVEERRAQLADAAAQEPTQGPGRDGGEECALLCEALADEYQELAGYARATNKGRLAESMASKAGAALEAASRIRTRTEGGTDG